MKTTALILGALLAAAPPAFADCVMNQKSAQYVRVLDGTTIILYGGMAGHTMIKTMTLLMPGANFAVGKDNFCDMDDQAIYMDGNPINIVEVKHVN